MKITKFAQQYTLFFDTAAVRRHSFHISFYTVPPLWFVIKTERRKISPTPDFLSVMTCPFLDFITVDFSRNLTTLMAVKVVGPIYIRS